MFCKFSALFLPHLFAVLYFHKRGKIYLWKLIIQVLTIYLYVNMPTYGTHNAVAQNDEI